jgi:hypothetical protein
MSDALSRLTKDSDPMTTSDDIGLN